MQREVRPLYVLSSIFSRNPTCTITFRARCGESTTEH